MMPELIDRIELRKDLCDMCEAMQPEMIDCKKKGCITMQIIDEQPTIEPEVRHGRWIPTEYDSYADGAPVWDKWECSECGHEHNGEEDTLTAFCPDCGTYMREGGADNVSNV